MIVFSRKVGDSIKIGDETITLHELVQNQRASLMCRGSSQTLTVGKSAQIAGAEVKLLSAKTSYAKIGIRAPLSIRIERL